MQWSLQHQLTYFKWWQIYETHSIIYLMLQFEMVLGHLHNRTVANFNLTVIYF